MEQYEEILLQAASENIGITEWIARRIALMNIIQREKEPLLDYLSRVEYQMALRDSIPGNPILRRARAFANIIP